MAQQIFEVTHEDERLILTRCLGPAFEKLLGLMFFALFVGVFVWHLMPPSKWRGWEVSLMAVLTLMLLALSLYFVGAEGAQFWRALKGDHYVFDKSEGTLERNGVVLCKLRELTGVRLVEDKEDFISHKLWLVQRDADRIVLEDNADRRWDELVRVAQSIAEFTGLEVEHQ